MFSRDLLEQLHDALGKALLDRLKDGSATASDLNVARQWLKDQGIEAKPAHNNPVEQLRDRLPTFDEGEDDSDLPMRH